MFIWLLILFYVFTVMAFGVISAVLVYHWRRYGRDSAWIIWFQSLYFIVGGILLILALGALFLFAKLS